MTLQFEFKMVNVPDEIWNEPEQILNPLGLEGWYPTGVEKDTGHGTMYLMQRIVGGSKHDILNRRG